MKISKFTLLFLTIEYIDISNIIKPNMTDISPPIMQTTSQPYVILPPIVTYTNLVLDTTVPGQLENITYYYSVTFYTDENESNSTPFNNSITVTNNSNIIINNIPISYDTRVVGRNIYRSTDNITFVLAFSVMDNTTIMAIDNNPTSTIITNNVFVNQMINLKVNDTTSSTMVDGTYYYKITYYTNYDESNPITLPPVTLSDTETQGKTIQINTIPISKDTNVIGRNIYRTNPNNTEQYYLLHKINDNETIQYTDSMGILTTNLESLPNNTYLSIGPIIKGIVSNVQPATYSYGITFYTHNTESNISYIPDIFVSDKVNSIVINNIPVSNDSKVIGRNIYRTQMNTTAYYLLDKIYNNTDTSYTDILSDNSLSNNSIPDTNYTQLLINKKTTGLMTNGVFYYAVSYYSRSTETDITVIPGSITVVTNNNVDIINLPISADKSVIGRKIYRTKANEMVFYLIGAISDNVTSIFNDDNNDSNLINSFLPKNNNICSKIPIILKSNGNSNYTLLNINKQQINLILNYNIISEIYIDSFNTTNYNIIPNFSYGYPNFNFSGFNPQSPSLYYLVNKNNIMDNIKLVVDPTSNLLVATNLVNSEIINYNILVVNLNGTVPNLEKYISLSTDYNYLNDKKITDTNDYLFSKPFMMLMNSSTENIFPSYSNLFTGFHNPYINFYNIPFKINSSSVITLNNNNVNYVMPLVTQQFFIKDTKMSDNYYTLTLPNVTGKLVNPSIYTNGVFMNRLSIEIDEFNMTSFDLNNGTIKEQMVNLFCHELNNTINTNSDILMIINLIQNIDDQFVSFFNSTINNTDIYGSSSRTILENIINTNTFNNIINNTIVTQNNTTNISSVQNNYNTTLQKLNIINYDTNDFFLYSYYTIPSSKSTYTNYNLLYKPYNSNNKLSPDLIQYLRDIKKIS
jgi:hypothetical protein